MKEPSCSRGALLAAALDCVVRQTYHYRGYETRDKALRALARRRPSLTPRRLNFAYDKAARAYAAAEALAVKHARRLIDAEQPAVPDAREIDRLLPRLAAQQPGFRQSTLRDALRWACYWRLLR